MSRSAWGRASTSLWKRSQADTDSWHGLFDTQAGPIAGEFILSNKRADTVGQPPSAEIGVSNMPSWKAKKLRELPREKVLLVTLKGVDQQYPGVIGAGVVGGTVD